LFGAATAYPTSSTSGIWLREPLGESDSSRRFTLGVTLVECGAQYESDHGTNDSQRCRFGPGAAGDQDCE